MKGALDPAIHQAIRLRIMALLHRNRAVSFTWLQRQLGATPGNLDSHLNRLADARYVDRWMALTPTGFQAHVKITPEGDAAFQTYILSLREILAADASSAFQKPGLE